MNKKGITISTNELIALVLLIPALIFIYFSYQYVAGLFAPAELDQATKDNFQRLVREIKDLVKDVELKEVDASAEITVPLYQKDSFIVVYNYDRLHEKYLELLPKRCHTENCICLQKRVPNIPPVECYEFADIYFESPFYSIEQEGVGQISVRLELTKKPVPKSGDYKLKIEKVKD